MFSNRRYKPVSQHLESESDSDKATVFTAGGSGQQKGEWHLGVQAYDLSQDLDLPQVHPAHHPLRRSKDNTCGYMRKRAPVCACVFVVTVTTLAVLIIMKVTTYAPAELPTSEQTELPTSPLLTEIHPTQSTSRNTQPESIEFTQIPSHETISSDVTISEPEAPTSRPQGIDWEQDFFSSMTEASIELFDMNRDGVMDVVTVEDFSGCTVRVIAMDGRNGTKFWQREVNFPAFGVRCELDVNSDGAMDSGPPEPVRLVRPKPDHFFQRLVG